MNFDISTYIFHFIACCAYWQRSHCCRHCSDHCAGIVYLAFGVCFILWENHIQTWRIGELHAFKPCTCFRADFVTILAASPNITSDHCDILCCLHMHFFWAIRWVHMVGHSRVIMEHRMPNGVGKMHVFTCSVCFFFLRRCEFSYVCSSEAYTRVNK